MKFKVGDIVQWRIPWLEEVRICKISSIASLGGYRLREKNAPFYFWAEESELKAFPIADTELYKALNGEL